MSNGIRCRLSGTVLLLVVIAVGMSGQEPRHSDQPISVHPKNPHYFLWKGQPPVLVASGEHYGSVINSDFGYKRYLATVSQAGLNHTRIFLGNYAEKEGDFGIVDNPLAPAPGRFLAPWARTSVPGYALGGNKFDLDRWNPEYFERLHAFMREAEQRNIVVEALLFPFSQIHRPAWLEAAGRSPVFNPTNIIELAIYVGAGHSPLGEGVPYFDDIKAVNKSTQPHGFSELADQALSTMRKRAGEVGITGVAVVAYFDGEEIQSWESKMTVVGKRKDPPSANDKGANLLAIAYAKAAEAADSLKPSGSAGRPLMTGEYGWPGSVIRKGRRGYWIAAFSGGKSEDDVALSNAGLDSIMDVE